MSHESLFAPEHTVDAKLTTFPSSLEPFEYGSPALLKVLREWFLNHPRDAKVAGLIVNLIDAYFDYFCFGVGSHMQAYQSQINEKNVYGSAS